MLPVIWSDSISNLFSMKFIFKCDTSISRLLVCNNFRNLLEWLVLSASSDLSEWHTTDCLLKLSVFSQSNISIFSYKNITQQPRTYWFKCNFFLFKWFLLILVEWLIRYFSSHNFCRMLFTSHFFSSSFLLSAQILILYMLTCFSFLTDGQCQLLILLFLLMTYPMAVHLYQRVRWNDPDCSLAMVLFDCWSMLFLHLKRF